MTIQSVKYLSELLDKFDKIPDSLKQENCWAPWSLEYRDKKPTKVPYRLDDGKYASSIDPDDWTSFPRASRALLVHRELFSGIGVFLGDGLAAVDLDHVRDAETGRIKAWARKVIDYLDSYTELSPSGTGVHILAKGYLDRGGIHRHGVEIYDSRRFMTVTGGHLVGTPRTLASRSRRLQRLAARVSPTVDVPVFSMEPLGLTDDKVLEVIWRSKQADKFRSLMGGDWQSSYGSQSDADFALCNLLAFYCDNPAQVERLFECSDLVRPKWRRADYREATLMKAWSMQTGHYRGHR